MKGSARYIKNMEWSVEDQCFVGQCLGVAGPCCYGDNEAEVYGGLCEIVDEWIDIFKQDGRPQAKASFKRLCDLSFDSIDDE
jgi:hypothetical protein